MELEQVEASLGQLPSSLGSEREKADPQWALGRRPTDVILPILWMNKLRLRVGKSLVPDPSPHILCFLSLCSVLVKITDVFP